MIDYEEDSMYFHEENIKCPWCDNEFEDSWEFIDDAGDILCHECDKKFGYERNTEITYSTRTRLCRDQDDNQ